MNFYTFQRVKIVKLRNPPAGIGLAVMRRWMNERPLHLVGVETHILPGRAIAPADGAFCYQVAADGGQWAFAAEEMEPIIPEGLEASSKPDRIYILDPVEKRVVEIPAFIR